MAKETTVTKTITSEAVVPEDNKEIPTTVVSRSQLTPTITYIIIGVIVLFACMACFFFGWLVGRNTTNTRLPMDFDDRGRMMQPDANNRYYRSPSNLQSPTTSTQ